MVVKLWLIKVATFVITFKGYPSYGNNFSDFDFASSFRIHAPNQGQVQGLPFGP